MLTVIGVLVGIAVGGLATWGWLRAASASRLSAAEDRRRAIVADAEREAEATRREAQIESRELAVQLRSQIESEVQDRRLQIAKVEERTAQREGELDDEADRARAPRAGHRRP